MKPLIGFILLVAVMPYVATEIDPNEILQMSAAMKNFSYPETYSEFYKRNLKVTAHLGTNHFIIIGGGSAGSALATRLSEVKKWKVLLLEAGQNETDISQVPAFAGLLQFTNMSWAFTSTPQNHCCLGMKEKKCAIPRGKVLGGSSSINFMMYTRGNRHDYDEMEAAGNLGWGYKNVLPYFKKLENASSEGHFDPAYHNFDGPINMEYVRHWSDISQGYLDAASEMGRKILDYNAADQMGFSHLESNNIVGQRCSTNRGYLTPVLDRPNLKVVKGAFVLELLFDPHHKKVVGVKFILNGKVYEARASKEVILSAGVVQSPQILMLSGIGPREHLERLGIKVKKDLPVGRNLHDHPFSLSCFSSNFTESTKPMDQMLQDYFNGKGFLTAAGDVQAIGYVNTKDPSATYPDIEHFISAFFGTNDGFFSNGFRYTDEIMNSYFKPYPAACMPLGITVLLHQKSRGSITLKSSCPFDHPNIDLNYFENQEDIVMFRAGIKDLYAQMETEAMKKFNISSPYNPVAGCEDLNYMSDDYLECLIRKTAVSLYHLAGTCKMGPPSDPNAVVDYFLKVKGVSNLRVIDASIIPNPLSGHTNIPTIMIAEKASDMIKQEYGIPTF